MALGQKTGGRKKGSRNKALVAREAAIAESGQTPLGFMLSTMRDGTIALDVRLEMAKAAAPYCHPRLSPVACEPPPPEPSVYKLSELDTEELQALKSLLDKASCN
jgi:hypothetical protein